MWKWREPAIAEGLQKPVSPSSPLPSGASVPGVATQQQLGVDELMKTNDKLHVCNVCAALRAMGLD